MEAYRYTVHDKVLDGKHNDVRWFGTDPGHYQVMLETVCISVDTCKCAS